MGAAPGAILAVGGAEDKVKKRAILQRFVREAGGRSGRIAIVPTASSIPEERASFYSEVFGQLGAGDCVHVPIVTRRDAQLVANAELVRSCSGVFLTGGDQTRLVSVLAETRSFEAIRTGLVAGGVVAGTSAGASAFSATMIVGGQTGLNLRRDSVRLGTGLGIITRLIIDQHFSQRDRLGRLLAAVASEPAKLGVGIDEDTAIVYYGNGVIEVIGTGQVFILDAARVVVNGLGDAPKTRPFSISEVALHVLTDGDRFNVVERRVMGADEGPSEEEKSPRRVASAETA
ncbi:MAG: cyanophycinase [Acidobacteria bacterium]|nr:cyanophycinase [Acidobacteriota bacterium]MCG3191963.1 Cyanophycinase [Thermoanaerobaculia bacterium]MCK6681765.1 cyanophycinase [Thermoanaerobaculia bacterium]